MSAHPKPRLRLDTPARCPAPRLPSPYRPDPKPHILRTVVLLALVCVCIVGIAYAASAIVGPGAVELPREVYQPSYPVTAPGWLEPTVPPPAP